MAKNIVYVSDTICQKYWAAMRSGDMFVKYFERVRMDFKKCGGTIKHSPVIIYSFTDLTEYVKTLKRRAAHHLLDKLKYVLLDFIDFGGVVMIEGNQVKNWLEINNALKK